MGEMFSSLHYFRLNTMQISTGIIGMKVNEQKRIPISLKTPMTYEWSAERLALNKINMSDIRVGDSSLWVFLIIR